LAISSDSPTFAPEVEADVLRRLRDAREAMISASSGSSSNTPPAVDVRALAAGRVAPTPRLG